MNKIASFFSPIFIPAQNEGRVSLEMSLTEKNKSNNFSLA